MKDELRPAHELEHAKPTVIHHSDENTTILGRWLQSGMDQGPRFWLWVFGAVAALSTLAVLTSGLVAGKSKTGQAWIDLIPAKSAEDQLKVAEAHPKTPVADWARLRAAFEEYDNGLIDLTTPGKKETAGPRLKKALELFGEVAREAPRDSSQAIGAALGVARTLEARNELPEAIKQYKLVAATWPTIPEARQAEALARALEEPENVMFYKELYAYKAQAGATGPIDLPPGASLPFDVKSMIPGPTGPSGLGGLDFKSNKPMAPAPEGLDAPPPKPGPDPTPTEPKAPAVAPKSELPVDPFSPPKSQD